MSDTYPPAVELLHKIDWAALMDQKYALVDLIHEGGAGAKAEALQGIVHLLDALQDAASEAGLPAYPEEEPEPEAPPRKFFRTRVTIDVLSEDEPWDGSLDWLSYDVTDGECVGGELHKDVEEVSAEDMVRLLQEAGSDPSFFQLD